MSKSTEPDTATLKDLLRKNGWREMTEDEQPGEAPIQLAEGESLDIGTLLNEAAESEEFELPEGVRPPPAQEKERVRNLAGGVFGSEELDLPVKKDPWTRVLPELGRVTITPGELEDYTRALLHDRRFELSIPILVGGEPLNVLVRSLYISERDVMACAVAEVAEKYPIQSLQNAALVADYFLKISILVQVVSVNGESAHPYDARPEEGVLPENSAKVAELATKARLAFGQMHQAKFKALVRALHTFETKQQILEDAFYNRDFRPPVDAY